MSIFKSAIPIWIKDKQNEPNCQAVFTADFKTNKTAKLYISGFTFYRVFINGRFIHFGPARTAYGFARVDEIVLNDLKSENTIVIEAAGYRCFALCTCNQPSFICAEIRDSNDTVIASTGLDFKVIEPHTRIKKAMRYSRQRHYSEIYDYRKIFKDYSSLTYTNYEPLLEAPIFIKRNAPIAEYKTIIADSCRFVGDYSYDESKEVKATPYAMADVMQKLGEFSHDEIPYLPYQYLQRCNLFMGNGSFLFPQTLNAGQYALIDLKKIHAGFISADIDALRESDVIIAFTEFCDNEFYVTQENNSVNAIEYVLSAEKNYDLLSLEPYSFRYILVVVKSGAIKLNNVGFITFQHQMDRLKDERLEDETLNNIWQASRRSFAHNSIDIYTDCPSRERGGWLCDSYFSAKVEHYLSGKSLVEQDFLENFVLRPADDPQKTSHGNLLPDNMLPMCYPSDHYINYIPQWSMWYVLELYEYLTERNTTADKEFFMPVVEKLIKFFERYENSDGLLEKLDGWNFVEWSKANSWVQDVNYPTNFLYSEMLRTAGKLLNRNELITKAERVEKTALEKSFNGEFFTDNAVYENGVLKSTGNISETCQYYALRFCSVDLNDPKYSVLKNAIMNVFGPKRTTEYPEIEKSNAFIGMYVRTEVMLKLKLYDKLLEDIKGYFGYMAKSTETLWENSEPHGSLNHGFASYAAYAMAIALNKL